MRLTRVAGLTIVWGAARASAAMSVKPKPIQPLRILSLLCLVPLGPGGRAVYCRAGHGHAVKYAHGTRCQKALGEPAQAGEAPAPCRGEGHPGLQYDRG